MVPWIGRFLPGSDERPWLDLLSLPVAMVRGLGLRVGLKEEELGDKWRGRFLVSQDLGTGRVS